LGRPETEQIRRLAMNVLGNGLGAAARDEESLSVSEAELATLRRIGDSKRSILCTLGNLASTYSRIGRLEEAVRTERDVYSGWVKLLGEENEQTLRAALNCASTLNRLGRHTEAKTLTRHVTPVARRVLGESNEITLKMRSLYADAVCRDTGATLDDLRESVMTLEDTDRTGRRVFGGTSPLIASIEIALRNARAVLRARETPSGSA
jgi:hypothetical protein